MKLINGDKKLKKSWNLKKTNYPSQILSSTTDFNIDNNLKSFLSIKSAY